ncbi:MAG: hypothetical protein R6U32_04500 [Candidatus Woesearchaeota archaeon]
MYSRIRTDKSAADKGRSVCGLMSLSLACIFFFIISLLIITPSASAVSIGLSPGVVNADNLMRGGYYERTVTVTISSDARVGVEAQIMSSEIEDWLELSETSFNISKDNPKELKLMVRPPSDVSNGDYTGNIRFVTTRLSTVGGEVGSAVRAAVDLKVNAGITDVEIVKCRAGGFKTPDIEEGSDLPLSFNIMNDGNVRFNPSISVFIWDQNMTEVVSFYESKGTETVPTQQNTMSLDVPADDLPLGQYWAEISVDECHSNVTRTFDIVEEGSLSSEGRLVRIVNNIWAETGETMPITAVFENTGNNTVLAKFVGRVECGGEVAGTLESEEYEVAPGTNMNLTTYFTPEKECRYVAKGHVVYNNKRTEEKLGVINARGEDGSAPDEGGVPIAAYLVLIVVALAIAIGMKKKKAKRRKF